MVRTSLSRLVSKFCVKRFAPTDILEKNNTGTGACLDMSQFRRPWQGPHFPVLWPRLGRKHLSPHPFSKRKAPAPKFVWTCEIFLIMVRTSLARRVSKVCANRFAPTSIFEKPTPAPELVWTCYNFSAHGRDLTFLCCVQDLAESICAHTPSQKQKPRRQSSLGHVSLS
jgi:hypothetical protein